MKYKFSSLVLLFGILFFSNNILAQKVYSYQFNNTLSCIGGGPDLKQNCTGTYSTDSLKLIGISRPVYNFALNCGLVFYDTNNFISNGTYSIETYVALDDAGGGLRKIIDFKNLTTENGFYDNANKVIFKSPDTTSGEFFDDKVWTFVTLTRNGTTKLTTIYANGQYVSSFKDTKNNLAVYDANKKLTFFEDDTTNQQQDASSGKVALINIYNYELDSVTATANFITLSNLFTGIETINPINTGIRIFQNPVINLLKLQNFEKQVLYGGIYNMNGIELNTLTLKEGTQEINVSYLPSGVYVLRVSGANGFTQNLKFIK